MLILLQGIYRVLFKVTYKLFERKNMFTEGIIVVPVPVIWY